MKAKSSLELKRRKTGERPEGLLPRVQQTVALRERLIQLSRACTIRQAAQDLGVDYSLARTWVSRYGKDVPIASGVTSDLETPVREEPIRDPEIDAEARRFAPPLPDEGAQIEVASREPSPMRRSRQGVRADNSLLEALDELARTIKKKAFAMRAEDLVKATKVVGELLLAARVMQEPLTYERIEAARQLTEGPVDGELEDE